LEGEEGFWYWAERSGEQGEKGVERREGSLVRKVKRGLVSERSEGSWGREKETRVGRRENFHHLFTVWNERRGFALHYLLPIHPPFNINLPLPRPLSHPGCHHSRLLAT